MCPTDPHRLMDAPAPESTLSAEPEDADFPADDNWGGDEVAATPWRPTACSACRGPIQGVYHMAENHVVCSACRLKRYGPANAGHGRPLAYGVGSALACAAAFALTMLVTHKNIGYVGLISGGAIGRAVSAGSRKRGGAVDGAIATVLTYLSLVASFIPPMLAHYMPPAGPEVVARIGPGLAALAMPFLQDGRFTVAQVLGLVFAWKFAASKADVTGPHVVDSGETVRAPIPDPLEESAHSSG